MGHSQEIKSIISERKGEVKYRVFTGCISKPMRYAAYLRISGEDQVGNYSIPAQRRAIETWVKAQKGTLVAEYTDEAKSALTDKRPAFQRMRRDARKRKFDALAVHKFDRFSRNRPTPWPSNPCSGTTTVSRASR